jgi:uncharacterized membrane protein
MLWLVLGILIFLGIHSVRMVAPDFRNTMMDRLGQNGWKGVYTLISFVGLGLIIWGFMQARPEAAFFYEPPTFVKHIAVALMWFSFVALAASSFPAGQIKAKLKHPMITGVKIWALAHLLANGDLASLILFLSFLGWAVWNRIVVKRRGDPTPEAGPAINDIKSIVAGTVLYLVFLFWAHGFLIGVSPIA